MSTVKATDRKSITKLTQRVQALEAEVTRLAKELAEARRYPVYVSAPPVWPAPLNPRFEISIGDQN